MGFNEMNIRETKDFALILSLNTVIFPLDELELDAKTRAWIVWEGKLPVGFATMRVLKKGLVYFDRCGLLERAKGLGLHSRLINVRLAYSRKVNAKTVFTYTVVYNINSMITLIRNKFEYYQPEYAYAGKNVYYFRKNL